MAIRNRTNEFLKSRPPARDVDRVGSLGASRSKIDEQPLLVSGSNPQRQPGRGPTTAPGARKDIEEGTRTPTWLELKKDIEIQLEITRGHMAELAELHKNHLLPSFDSSETERQEREIEKLTTKITTLFHQCQAKVARLDKEGGILPAQETQMRRNIQSSIATQLQDLLSLFRKAQNDYLSQLTQNQQKKREMFSYNVPATHDSLIMTPFDGPENPDDNPTEDLEGEELHTLQPRQKDANRSREIQTLYRSIQELADIVKDISAMVVDQGTILDRIDYNIEASSVYTTGALVELRKANESHKSARTKYCILLLCILIMILVVVVIMKGTLRAI